MSPLALRSVASIFSDLHRRFSSPDHDSADYDQVLRSLVHIYVHDNLDFFLQDVPRESRFLLNTTLA